MVLQIHHLTIARKMSFSIMLSTKQMTSHKEHHRPFYAIILTVLQFSAEYISKTPYNF